MSVLERGWARRAPWLVLSAAAVFVSGCSAAPPDEAPEDQEPVAESAAELGAGVRLQNVFSGKCIQLENGNILMRPCANVPTQRIVPQAATPTTWSTYWRGKLRLCFDAPHNNKCIGIAPTPAQYADFGFIHPFPTSFFRSGISYRSGPYQSPTPPDHVRRFAVTDLSVERVFWTDVGNMDSGPVWWPDPIAGVPYLDGTLSGYRGTLVGAFEVVGAATVQVRSNIRGARGERLCLADLSKPGGEVRLAFCAASRTSWRTLQ